MNDFQKLAYFDLRHEAMHRRLPTLVGREEEMARLSRIMSRQSQSHVALIGSSGVGKTSLVRGWSYYISGDSTFQAFQCIEIEAASLYQLGNSGILFSRFQEAIATLPRSIVIIDHFGQLIFNKPQILLNLVRLMNPAMQSGKVSLIASFLPHEYEWLAKEDPAFAKNFENLVLKLQSDTEIISILEQETTKLVGISNENEIAPLQILEQTIALCKRFPTLGTLPQAGITLLDEAASFARSQGALSLTASHLHRVVADKTGIPITQLEASEKELLKRLGLELQAAVIGQPEALRTLTSAVQRAKLGLKNPNRPLGSFLVLGPSGVGKTETAKTLALKVFGKSESFTRIDMSEFAESHTVQRLIGAPPGYVGFDAGGGLTNPVKKEPYSLILLDEIEKAHVKIFDVFLQLLDDGRLTSGQGETIDFTNTIVMATSNIGVPEIIEQYQAGGNVQDPGFIETKLIPELAKHFRLEFINRFDAILVYKPLSVEDLLEIAQLEIQKIEHRIAHHQVTFEIDREMLVKEIEHLHDPRFGARPVKRYIEQMCESLITEKLLE